MFNNKNVKNEIKELIEFDLKNLDTIDINKKNIEAEINTHRIIALKYQNELDEIQKMSLEEFKQYAIELEKKSLARENELILEYKECLKNHEQDVKTCDEILSKANSSILIAKTEKIKFHRESLIKNIKKQIPAINKRIASIEKEIESYNAIHIDFLRKIKKDKISSIETMLKRENKTIDKLLLGDGFYSRNVTIIEEGNQALEELDKILKY